MSRKCGVLVAVHIMGEAPSPAASVVGGFCVWRAADSVGQSWRRMAGQQSPSHLTLNNNRIGLLGLAPRCCWEAFFQSKVVGWRWNIFSS